MTAQLTFTRLTKLVGQSLLQLMWPRPTSLKAAMPNNQVNAYAKMTRPLTTLMGHTFKACLPGLVTPRQWSAMAAANAVTRREQMQTSIAKVQIVVDAGQWYALLGVVIGLPAP
jgi:hypothetical protein